MTRKTFATIIIAATVLAFVYAIVLQVTGQHDAAERFVSWAGGGIASVLVVVLLFVDLE